MEQLPIGIFDSGIGGLGLLKEAEIQMPCEKFIYLCDEENMPYGEKSDGKIYSLALAKCRELEKDCKAILIACNTVTGVCIGKLRQNISVPIVAVEPAVAKAKRLYSTNILVLATTATVRQKNFASLLYKHGKYNFEVIADKNLAKIIQDNYSDKQNLSRLVIEATKDYPKNKSCVVLGCTHYVEVAGLLSHILQAPAVDGNVETIRQLKKVVMPNAKC